MSSRIRYRKVEEGDPKGLLTQFGEGPVHEILLDGEVIGKVKWKNESRQGLLMNSQRNPVDKVWLLLEDPRFSDESYTSRREAVASLIRKITRRAEQ